MTWVVAGMLVVQVIFADVEDGVLDEILKMLDPGTPVHVGGNCPASGVHAGLLIQPFGHGVPLAAPQFCTAVNSPGLLVVPV
jgi:hypothetical protein